VLAGTVDLSRPGIHINLEFLKARFVTRTIVFSRSTSSRYFWKVLWAHGRHIRCPDPPLKSGSGRLPTQDLDPRGWVLKQLLTRRPMGSKDPPFLSSLSISDSPSFPTCPCPRRFVLCVYSSYSISESTTMED
jgi:hypothetical protein